MEQHIKSKTNGCNIYLTVKIQMHKIFKFQITLDITDIII